MLRFPSIIVLIFTTLLLSLSGCMTGNEGTSKKTEKTLEELEKQAKDMVEKGKEDSRKLAAMQAELVAATNATSAPRKKWNEAVEAAKKLAGQPGEKEALDRAEDLEKELIVPLEKAEKLAKETKEKLEALEGLNKEIEETIKEIEEKKASSTITAPAGNKVYVQMIGGAAASWAQAKSTVEKALGMTLEEGQPQPGDRVILVVSASGPRAFESAELPKVVEQLKQKGAKLVFLVLRTGATKADVTEGYGLPEGIPIERLIVTPAGNINETENLPKLKADLEKL